MTTNIDELILSANTEGLARGEDAYDDLGDAAERAERRVDGATDDIERSNNNMAAGVAKAALSIAAAYVTIETAVAAIRVAADFDAALAEASTLIDGTVEEMAALEQGAKDLAFTFGTDATEQVNAYYQAISSGAEDVAAATEILVQSNKLAEGGITDVTTGVDALTTAINAYGPDVISASEASDALFVGMRAGKTTIGELSSQLGNIVPIASSVGVSFDEVVAGISALTTQGLSTSSATTGLRQVLASVVKPTADATAAAEALGIEFNSQGLQAQGLAGFLEEVIQKTGGNTEVMGQLFGSVEALGAALAFAGGGGEAFTAVMADMEMKLGATDEAVEKINASLSDRLDDSLARLALVGLEFGQVLLTVAVPALEALVSIVTVSAENLDVFAAVVIGLALTQIPAAIAAIATFTTGMSLASVATGVATTAMGLFRSALIVLGGPLGLVYGLLGGAAALFLLLDENAGIAEIGMYDAAAGSAALNAELGVFYTTGAPSAGAAAIALANDNYKLADSAYAAARAELAKNQALLDARNSAGAAGSVGSIRDTGILVTDNDVAADQDRLDKAKAALNQAMNDRNRAVTSVTGSNFEGVTFNPQLGPDIPVLKMPDLPDMPDFEAFGGGGGGGGRGGGANKKLTETQKLMDAGAVSAKNYEEAVTDLNTSIMGLEFDEILDAVESISGAMLDAAFESENFGDVLENMARAGVDALAELAQQMLKTYIQQQLLNAVSGGLSGGAGGQGGADVSQGGGLLASLFGGNRASGGPVRAGKAYKVNEKTANSEIFVPSQSGGILNVAQQQDAIRHSAPPNVNVAAPEVIVINDPRQIDAWRMTPKGEKARMQADRRAGLG